jgi:hypothetical protein
MSETNTQPFANVRSAKIGSELSPIGRGLLQIGTFCFPAYIFRDDELQESLLGLNPLTKQGFSATFTNETFSLFHDLNKEPILHGSKTANQNSWRVAIQPYHGYPMWGLTSPTSFYEIPHDWDTTICSDKKTRTTSANVGRISDQTRTIPSPPNMGSPLSCRIL